MTHQGEEYAEKRRNKALLTQAQESIRQEATCSFKPLKVAHYETNASHDLPFQERSQAWKKRRDERIAKQREELKVRTEIALVKQLQAKQKRILEILPEPKEYVGREGSLSSKTPDRSYSGKRLYGEFTPKRPTMTEEEYINSRLNNIRRSIEKQMSYVDSKRSWSRSKSRDD